MPSKVQIGSSMVSLEIVESYAILVDMVNSQSAIRMAKRDILACLATADQAANMLERCTVKELASLPIALSDKITRAIRQRREHFIRAEAAQF